jgi:hypothetical protein
MVPIPTEADEEARRAYRGIGGLTGASGGGPDRLGDLQPSGRDDVSAPAAHSRPDFFLRPDCVHHVPEAVGRYHSKHFREAYEAVKRLDYDDGIVPRGARPG